MPQESPLHPPAPRLATLLRMVIYGLSGAAAAWPLTAPSVVITTALGAALGVALARLVTPLPARDRLVILGSALLALLSGTLGWFITQHSWLSSLSSPQQAFLIAEAIAWGGSALAISIGLRTLVARHAWLAPLEIIAVALAFAQLVVAHRQGAINRPYTLTDPLIAYGYDPTWIFLSLGAIACLLMVLLLLRESRLKRLLVHLALIIAAMVGITLVVQQTGLPSGFKHKDSLGLRGKAKQSQGKGKKGGNKAKRDDALSFRDDYNDASKQIPVAIVLLHDDYIPPTSVYYFRQGAFSQFNGNRLISTTEEGIDQDIAEGFPAPLIEVRQTPPSALSTRGKHRSTVALLTEHTRPFGLESPLQFKAKPNPGDRRFKRVYEVISLAFENTYVKLVTQPAGNPDWSPSTWKHYTQYPDDDRYAELAERIVNELLPEHLKDSALARALALTAWLGDNSTYSLKSKHASAEDPTAHFLFGNRTGYCVHLAHATAYLLRALGLPSRVATGYAAEESTRQGGSALLLAGKDAHAWAEIYLEGHGWLPMDVTPQRVLDPPPPPVDPELQRLLAEMLRGQPLVPESMAHEQYPWVAKLGTWTRAALWVLAALAVALLLLLFCIKILRRLGHRWVPAQQQLRWAYRACLDSLSELNCRRAEGESHQAFAQRLQGELPSLTPLTQWQLRQRFADPITPQPTSSDQQKTALRQCLQALRQERRRRFAWWRRFVGLLIPWSWLGTR